MLPIAMIPTGWALLIEPWRKIECLAVAFLTFMAASVVTVWAFGPGLLQVVLDTPGLAQSAAAIGIPPAPIQRSASYRLAARSCVTLWRYSNLFQPLFFSTLFGCLDRHAGHDRASHFSAWRESSQRHVKPIDLVLGYFWITAIFALSPVAILLRRLHHPVYELLPPALGIGSGRVDRRNSSADG
jgi:hypothetical protein